MIDPKQLREFIDEVLREFARVADKPSLYSKDAVELLMLTAAQETHLGRYLKQIKGPALGIFQIEPATLADLITNYLMYRGKLGKIVQSLYVKGLGMAGTADSVGLNMQGNLILQVVIARLIYRRVPEPLPDNRSHEAMAQYWKKYWNTSLGRGTVEEAVQNYQKYVLEW